MEREQEMRSSRIRPALGISPERRHGSILLCLALWSTIAFLLIQRFVVAAVVVEGRSMTPTLMPGDRCIVNCWLPRFRQYQRGDLVVVRDPDGRDLMVKRIIGLPNDQLQLKGGHVYVNGKILVEPYVLKDNYTYSRQLRSQVIHVASGSYFVMGDNRLHSEDSRAYGDIDRAALVGLISR
jgi:signal peptidase I